MSTKYFICIKKPNSDLTHTYFFDTFDKFNKVLYHIKDITKSNPSRVCWGYTDDVVTDVDKTIEEINNFYLRR